MYQFGSGVLMGTPAGTNQTPVNFGLIQEATYDEAGTLKSLYGQNRRALAVGAGTIKTTLKAKSARISGLMFASLYYGLALSSGMTATAIGEAGTIPASSTFTIQVANHSTFTADQGVVYAATGLPLKNVASLTAVGQYTFSAGVYTFFSGDAAAKVLISYNYTVVGGQSFTINNPLIGPTVSFASNLYGVDPTNGNALTLQLYNVVMAKLSFGTKLEDFTLPDFEGECYVNGAGNMGAWNFPDSF